ncbi:VanZ family protein [Actinomadura sp. HBU206391]|uniref:VanZ family protein n=1 Tax=Actinomadura sp. HBU206391 TaxID=2731692 RepID=UPI00164FB48B|nr:VanZ family protein [Actinomadura sp. HBU206391]MBC6462799.1 VanZ family protein [Actinomadura sp. HBU206391]
MCFDRAAVLGPALVVFTLVALARRRGNVPGWRGGPLALRAVTALYAAAVASLTFFPLWIYGGDYRNRASWIGQVQPIPLLTADISMIPNVIMFVPLGFLLPLLSHGCTLGRTAVTCALVSLGIELTQMLQYIALGNGRAVDIDDLIANTLGGLLGYAALRTAQRADATHAVLNRLFPPPNIV